MSDETKNPSTNSGQETEEKAPEVKEVKEETPVAKSEAKDEAPVKEEEKEVEVEMTADQKKIVDQVEKMTVLELHQLVKVLEKKFDVSAQAVAVAGPATSGDAEEEKNEFTVELTDVGPSKIGVIKAIKSMLGLGLKEAKDLVDDAPSVLKEGVKKEEAEELKAAIVEAGGSVELK